ncbi:MAG: glycoside hydrolase family 88 protein [Rhodocyclaceae bacterium]|nr:glycoside hydrolase family 88 protein [Rhodocyclaceae bacterium]
MKSELLEPSIVVVLTRSPIAQRERLIALSIRYSWWLGNRSVHVRHLQDFLGWRLSRISYRLLRRPQGALSWPLGLALLSLNADPEIARSDLSWVRQCFSGLIDRNGKSLLPRPAVDQGGMAYAALRLYGLLEEEKYLGFALDLGRSFSNQPGAAAGLIPYTVGRREVLVDTVGMLCPFLARLTRVTHDTTYRDIALAQLDAMWRHGGAGVGWISHAFDSANFTPLGIRGWGRGVGWLLLGITDTICELADGPERDQWLGRGLKLLSDLHDCQRSDGHWPWRLDDANAHADSSVTAFVAYCLARWTQSIAQDLPQLNAMEERCNAALEDVTDRHGRIGSGSGEAGGIGSYSPGFGHFLWAQGPTVAANRINSRRLLRTDLPSGSTKA